MKIDKESLLKNRFWVGLIAFGPLWLILLIVALVFCGDTAAKNAKELKDGQQKVTGLKDIKNENYTGLLAAKQKDLEKQKDKVWAEAWKGQTDLMKWPGIDGREQLQDHGYFGEELSPTLCRQFKDDGKYNSQLTDEEVANRLRPILPRDKEWGALIRHTDFQGAKGGKDPTNEEVWLSQEDVWVQDELINIIKAALDSAAHFDNLADFKKIDIPQSEQDQLAGAQAAPAAPATKPASSDTAAGDEKKSVIVRQRFRSLNWQLDLVMEQNDKQELTATPQTTVMNLDAGRAVPGLEIQVRQKVSSTSKPPAPQVLTFAPAAKAGDKVTLTKEVALTGFDANLDALPLVVKVSADKSEAPLPAGTVRQRFRNPNWELDLLIQKTEQGTFVVSKDSTLTNINPTRRSLSLATAEFRVRSGENALPLAMPGEWLAWSKTIPIQQSFPVADINNYPLEVEQVFTTAYTSPIKFVNGIYFPGSTPWEKCNSHRTANLVAKSATQFVEPPKEAAAASPQPGGASPGGGGPAGGPAAGAAMPGGGSMPGGSGAPGGAAASDTGKTHYGLVRNRYISVTEQVRHMPVALSLVVEQAYMQDVLTAVINSRLRIQITQVQWKRLEGIKSNVYVASSGTSSGGGNVTVPPPGGLGSTPGSRGSLPGGRTGGTTPPIPGGGGAGTKPPTIPPGGGGGGRMSGSGPSSPAPPGGGGAGRVSGSGPSSPGPGGGRPSGSGSTPGGGITPPGGSASAAVPTDETDPNLVEVAVYGIAALYERYHEWFKITGSTLQALPEPVAKKLESLKDKDFKRDEFVKELAKALDQAEMQRYGTLVMSYAESAPPKPAQPVADGGAEKPAAQPPK
jgi:hypothetical protein